MPRLNLMLACWLRIAAILVCAVPPAIAGEVVSTAAASVKAASGTKIIRLNNLAHRTARHSSPDAIVCLPGEFRADKPVNVVIFLHGLTNTLDDVLRIWRLERALDDAPKNTVIIMPEWAVNPKAYSREAGRFHDQNFFREMLVEILGKVPELKSIRLKRLTDMAVVSYSGGFRAARSVIERNGLEEQISHLVLLDSLYVSDWFDRWLYKNIDALACGRKRYYNFFFDTAQQSKAQQERLKLEFARCGKNYRSCITEDLRRPTTIMRSYQLKDAKVVYKMTTLHTGEYTSHMNVVALYFPRVLKSMALRERREEVNVAGAAGEIKPAQSSACDPKS